MLLPAPEHPHTICELDGKLMPYEADAVAPYSKVQPSFDAAYWRCRRSDGSAPVSSHRRSIPNAMRVDLAPS
jgi:hypothetical protein